MGAKQNARHSQPFMVNLYGSRETMKYRGWFVRIQFASVANSSVKCLVNAGFDSQAKFDLDS